MVVGEKEDVEEGRKEDAGMEESKRSAEENSNSVFI